MSDDKSLDVAGVKPLAKAIETITVKTVEGLGHFFGAICMPAATEFGLLLKDQVSAYRLKNLESIAEKTKARLKERTIAASGQTNPRLVKEVVEEASWCGDETIQSMWAGLLSVASGTDSVADDSLVYTDILKRLTPFQAAFLNAVYSDPRCCSLKHAGRFNVEDAFYPENKLIYSNVEVLSMFPGDLSTIVPVAYQTHNSILQNADNHSIAISRFRPQIEGLKTLGMLEDVKLLNGGKEGVNVFPNLKGLDLYMRGLGYSIYPLEAFLVTLQHWNRERGIDPFTYKST